MRKNPYLKQEQEFRPLLMRGALGNDFLNTDAQMMQGLRQALKLTKETYTLNGISFDMVLGPSLNKNGALSIAKNVEMCTTECTQELFEEVMGFNYSDFPSKSRPIENVTWFDSIAFCNKLSEMLGYMPYYEIDILEYGERLTEKNIRGAEVNIIGGNGFRLPTSEEWLAFARARTNNRWSGTDNEEEVGDYAWHQGNSNSETHPVATKKPNEWGMYDMSGNVYEWVWDKWDATNVNTSTHRGFRGGGGNCDAPGLYSVNFHNFPPRGRVEILGFRFARTIEQQK